MSIKHSVKSKRGLTLVELVVAFALLAIVGMLMFGAITYVFRTSVYASSKTSTSLLTAGELQKLYSDGIAMVGVTLDPEDNTPLVISFSGSYAPLELTGSFLTAKSNNEILNSGQKQKYEVFKYKEVVFP